MPFKSEKQRRWMHANEPEMADEWETKEESLRQEGDSGSSLTRVAPIEITGTTGTPDWERAFLEFEAAELDPRRFPTPGILQHLENTVGEDWRQDYTDWKKMPNRAKPLKPRLPGPLISEENNEMQIKGSELKRIVAEELAKLTNENRLGRSVRMGRDRIRQGRQNRQDNRAINKSQRQWSREPTASPASSESEFSNTYDTRTGQGQAVYRSSTSPPGFGGDTIEREDTRDLSQGQLRGFIGGATFPAIDYRPPEEDSRKSTWRGPRGHIKGIELGPGPGQQMPGNEYYQAQDDFRSAPVQVGEHRKNRLNQIIREELGALLSEGGYAGHYSGPHLVTAAGDTPEDIAREMQAAGIEITDESATQAALEAGVLDDDLPDFIDAIIDAAESDDSEEPDMSQFLQ